MSEQITPQTVDVETAGKLLGYGRSLTYRLVKKGVIPAIKIARKYRVPIAVLDEMLHSPNKFNGEVNG